MLAAEPARRDLTERLAASVYSRRNQRAKGQLREAVGHFSRTATLAPWTLPVRRRPVRRRGRPLIAPDWSQAATVLGRLPHPLPWARVAAELTPKPRPSSTPGEGQLGSGCD